MAKGFSYLFIGAEQLRQGELLPTKVPSLSWNQMIFKVPGSKHNPSNKAAESPTDFLGEFTALRWIHEGQALSERTEQREEFIQKEQDLGRAR